MARKQSTHSIHELAACIYRLVPLALLALACLAQDGRPNKTGTGEWWLGDWMVVEDLPVRGVTALTDEEAHALIGKTLQVSEDSLVFDAAKLTNPVYERRSMTQGDLQLWFRIVATDAFPEGGGAEMVSVMTEAGQPWTAPGGVLLRGIRGTVLMVPPWRLFSIAAEPRRIGMSAGKPSSAATERRPL